MRQYLGTHPERAADATEVGLREFALILKRYPKVSNFNHSIFHQQVACLDIPVNDISLMQKMQSLENLPHNLRDIFFLKDLLLIPHDVRQGSIWTVLHQYPDFLLKDLDTETSYDVGMYTRGHYLNFKLNCLKLRLLSVGTYNLCGEDFISLFRKHFKDEA